MLIINNQNNPKILVIWLHGLGANSSDFKDFSEFKKFLKTRSMDDDLKKVKYALLKEDGPFTDFNSYIIVNKGKTENESVIQWTARFYRTYKLNPPIPKGQDDATAKAAVQKIVEKGLADLKKALSN